MLRVRSFKACYRNLADKSFIDHYSVLGLNPTATAKEVKAAYYKLSKQHHPDTNPDDQKEAAVKFQQVLEAYEILGSDELRKIYDLNRRNTISNTSSGFVPRSSMNRPHKQYTDIDIDYKNFEQFQRHNRRRRLFHSHFEMPEEFYAELGRRVKEENTEKLSSNYKDSRAMKREQEELLREMEREIARQQVMYPIPTFEQLMSERRKKKVMEQKKYLAGLFIVCTSGIVLCLLLKNVS